MEENQKMIDMEELINLPMVSFKCPIAIEMKCCIMEFHRLFLSKEMIWGICGVFRY
jgi:hypothetical protein